MKKRHHIPNAYNKIGNGYAKQVSSDLYDAIPKAVWAAIAISFGTCGGDRLEKATGIILKEWQILNENDIVPQPVPARFRKLIPVEE